MGAFGWRFSGEAADSPRSKRGIQTTLSIVGCVLIAYGLLKANEKLFPGWWAMVPVLGAAMLIAAGSGTWLNSRILSWRPIVGLGLISYPLYLWHWPLISFAHILTEEQSVALMAGLVAASVILAVLTYWRIEPKFRFSQSRGFSAALLSVAAIVVGVSGATTYEELGFRERGIALVTEDSSEAGDDWDYDPTTLKNGKIEKLNVLTGVTSDSVLFIGDSLMGQYFPRVKEMYRDHPQIMTAVFASRDHCTHSSPENSKHSRSCQM